MSDSPTVRQWVTVRHRAVLQDHEGLGRTASKVWSSFLVPQGYPSSVSPAYKEYMFWRGVQYFFGGAISVFTTKALLTSIGIKRNAGASAAAINWVVKDGAGRVGRFVFARWGHQLDCELKQFRLLGDGLLEAGAVLELCTAAAPGQFLLLACTANLLKNIAAVAASTTRAPIYRTFALSNNMADVTAKGESVANLSDIAGVATGIMLSRLRWPLWATIGGLSIGYVVASRKEVDSVILPYMNQVRCCRETRSSAPKSGRSLSRFCCCQLCPTGTMSAAAAAGSVRTRRCRVGRPW
jgi:Vitamin B6 photo-protection and homoeostasis